MAGNHKLNFDKYTAVMLTFGANNCRLHEQCLYNVECWWEGERMWGGVGAWAENWSVIPLLRQPCDLGKSPVPCHARLLFFIPVTLLAVLLHLCRFHSSHPPALTLSLSLCLSLPSISFCLSFHPPLSLLFSSSLSLISYLSESSILNLWPAS